ncbi:hypothetical protein BofuT4_P058190.1 [Botrytis cinerea T4]|uniref:Uncharacterized protein n=1 Tax=Botryotinia fuckeliana (strain T4) TaxID=999810 RepID=G2XUR9_BOTF4|nr:hypothetical protein BofuT4_P058190.1 [Botrytis cinerea T4]
MDYELTPSSFSSTATFVVSIVSIFLVSNSALFDESMADEGASIFLGKAVRYPRGESWILDPCIRSRNGKHQCRRWIDGFSAAAYQTTDVIGGKEYGAALERHEI